MDFDAFKQGQKAMWAMGDYPDLARMIVGVAERVVEKVGAGPDKDMLDVATGSGNVAIPAAERGANVTGLDLTPELLEVARRRAAEAGLEVRWIEGDAEELPFEDASFDLVSSCFGVIFAPRHERAASELRRVARPGARIAFTAWTPEGMNGELFRAIGSHMPPPPPEVESPVLWGTEDHVRSLFADSGVELSFERHMVDFTHDSPESWVEYNERVLGPTIMAKTALEPQGKWGELKGQLVDFYRERNEATDGSFRAPAEYLLTVAEVPV
ncbi:MAG TPA: class I SAM-dependent methyltransferase [Solirubrobacteraceae bacterium]